MRNETPAQRLVQEFRGAYGRLCVLTALGLRNPQLPDGYVLEASRGKGVLANRELRQLRRQRQRVSSAVEACTAPGVTVQNVIDAAHEAKAAVEQEWRISLPMGNPE